MKRKIGAIFGAGLLAVTRTVALSVTGAAPAFASCSPIGSYRGAATSWTRVLSNDCAGNVQARVWRYYNGTPQAIDGAKSRNSYATSSLGIAAENAFREQIDAGGAWEDWESLS